MRANKKPTIDLSRLLEIVKKNPGMCSLELGRKVGPKSMSSRARQVFIYKQSMKYSAMGQYSPVFFQKIGGKKLWFIMAYAIKEQLEHRPAQPEPIIDESLIVREESETLTLRQACINYHWIHLGASV